MTTKTSKTVSKTITPAVAAQAEVRERNGAIKPLRGKCLEVWQLLDEAPAPVQASEVLDIALAMDLRPQYVALMRLKHARFHGFDADAKLDRKSPAARATRSA